MSAVPKFVDNSGDVVSMAVAGVAMTNPNCQRIANTNVLVAKDIDPTKVLLISGGGAGHEPAHTGFVARGWLSAAVCGDVFSAPPAAHISAAIEHLAGLQGPHGPGLFVVVMNYTGDIFNFEFAIQQARRKNIAIELALAADDTAFGIADRTRRRALAGCCLQYKMLGAAAARGATLAQLKALAERISGSNMRSLGAALSSCALPHSPPLSSIPPRTVELGIGVHGERGLEQIAYDGGASALAKTMIHVLIGKAEWMSGPQHIPPLSPRAKVLLLVNNLGSSTRLELNTMAYHALHALEAAGVTVVGVNVGRHMTSLEMHGVSFTILNIAHEDDLELVLHTRALQAPLMNFHVPVHDPQELPGPMTALQLAQQAAGQRGLVADASTLSTAVHAVFATLAGAAQELNALDAAAGNGDLGYSVQRSATAVLAILPYLQWQPPHVGESFRLIAKAVADASGGASGPLYGTFLAAGGGAAQQSLESGHSAVEALRAALAAGTKGICEIGGAKRGDRSMLDVLLPLVESPIVQHQTTVPALLSACLTEARVAALAARQLQAQVGRSRYLYGKEVGVADPGAELVVLWLEVLANLRGAPTAAPPIIKKYMKS